MLIIVCAKLTAATVSIMTDSVKRIVLDSFDLCRAGQVLSLIH